MNLKQTSFVLWKDVKITGGFWKKRLEINENVTLPAEYEQCKVSGRVDSIKCLYHPEVDKRPEKGVFTIDGVLSDNLSSDGSIPRPHHYWDSDLAKWIEAASYSLISHPNKETEKRIDDIVDDFEKLQQPDGYLNTYYTVVEPGKRWTNVFAMHELYCAGHLIEAACAYFWATGKHKFLDIVCRYADCIDRTFGPEKGKIHGYPGHQEIELALVKLFHITGEKRYLNLSLYFINERGKKPYFFDIEAQKNGRDPEEKGPKGILGRSYLAAGPYALFQSHLPVREQKTAEGHAVRVTYMGCAMADLAAETGDKTLWDACLTLWNNITQKRMYITGGVGSQEGCERFNFDYQLPNETAYQETCASVGMVMWALRMLQVNPEGQFADFMERTLYNGVLSGVSLSGDSFFYANHLAAEPQMFSDRVIRNPRMLPVRQKWFAVSCCPMNLARLMESISGYIYSENDSALYIHLFAESETVIKRHGGSVKVIQKTEYPWDNRIRITVNSKENIAFRLAVRNPGFSRNTKVFIQGKESRIEEKNGYLIIDRHWDAKTEILVELDMKPEFVEAHPSVRMNAGKVAIQYGPFIYCLEETDNGAGLASIFADPFTELSVKWESSLLGGIQVVEGTALKRSFKGWENTLYRQVSDHFEKFKFRAVPYYTWSNREPGEMTVWLNRTYKGMVEDNESNGI